MVYKIFVEKEKTLKRVLLLSLFFFVQPVFAVPETAPSLLKIEPTFQEIAVSEVQQAVGAQITLTNNTAVQQIFTLSAVDIQQFGADGQVFLADKPISGGQYALAEFVKIKNPNMTLKPGQSSQVAIEVINSQQLAPGGHYAAVVAQGANAAQDQGLQQVLPALSSFLLIKKSGGEVYHLSLTPPEVSKQFLFFNFPKRVNLTFSNEGNVHVVPRGVIALRDVFGRVTDKGIINEDSTFVFPGTQKNVVVTLQEQAFAWPIMIYSLHIVGHSEPGDIPYQLQSAVVIVQPWAVVVLVGIVCGFFIVRRRKMHEQ